MPITLDGSLGITTPSYGGTDAAEYLVPVTAFKNRIINGAMNIWQRGTSFTLVSGATQYTSDRWYANTTGGAGVVARTGSVGSYSMQMTGASGVTVAFIGQKIESFNSADLAGQTVTVTATISSSTLTSLAWYTRFPTAQDNYAGVTSIANGTLTINSTPTQYTFSFSAPSGVTNGLELYFLTGAFTSGTLTITNVQLEKGSTATSFDYRPYGTELALCQRYLPAVSGNGNTLGFGIGYSTTSTYCTVPFLVTPRVAPTGISVSSPSHFNVTDTVAVSSAASAITFINSGTSSAILSGTLSSGAVTVTRPTTIASTSASANLYFTGCEL